MNLEVSKIPLSVFVINYNGADYLEGCLASLPLCEQLIYIDKGSTDQSLEIAKQFTDEIYQVPWSPIVEDTRPFALQKCRHEWVLFLDHDEMLDNELWVWLIDFINNDGFGYDAAAISRKNYYFGCWSEKQRSWPSKHVRLFRKPLGHFEKVIHTTVKLNSDKIYQHPDSGEGAIIHHGYETLSQWLAKADRYTSNTQWDSQPLSDGSNLFSKVSQHLDIAKRTYEHKGGDTYDAISHLLLFLYRTLDEVKHWEAENTGSVRELYLQQRQEICRNINKQFSISP